MSKPFNGDKKRSHSTSQEAETLKKQKSADQDTTMTDAAEKLAFEDRNSRLIFALDATGNSATLKKLQESSVLISGVKGLGIEVAKNVVLMGTRSVTIHDQEIVTLSDLSSHFYLSEDQVGHNRAEASRTKLAELNPRVDLNVHTGPLTEDFLRKFRVVMITNAPSEEELLRISTFCRNNKILFIAADAFGLFGYVFDDFGLQFEVTDRTGEPEKKGFIDVLTEDGLISLLESKRHDLEEGDWVRLTEVKNATEVNDKEFKVVKIKDATSFYIGGEGVTFSTVGTGGEFTEVKKPIKIDHQSWKELTSGVPSFDKIQIADYSKFDRPPQYFLAMRALHSFRQKFHRLPLPGNETDAVTVVQLATQINESLTPKADEVDTKLIRALARQAAGDVSPMAAFLGGIIGQEIIKACSGKFTPLNQFFFFDSLEVLPEAELTEEELKPLGNRYDGQTAVLGRTLQAQVQDSKYFLIGAGAIGCEMLKNWAMMGVGTSANGYVHVTDMDAIEISNLNRQFLYREWDVKKMKSEVAAAAVKKMNPTMNLKAWTIKVGPDTENVLDDDFWSPLTGICNALDNVNARLYTDSRAIFYRKSLLESGTLGPKGNTQVIVPFQTESYGSSVDPPEKNPPVCLVHSFPHAIEHCLQWARELVFEGRFVSDPDIVNKYLEKPNYLDTISPNLKRSTLETLRDNLINRQQNFDECILYARNLFEKLFVNDIKQLLYQFPADFKDPKTGAPFWSGAKRAPDVHPYDAENPTHLGFVTAVAYLRAWNLALLPDEFKPADFEAKKEHVKKVSSAIVMPEWKPKGLIKIETDEKVTTAETTASDDDDVIVNEILGALPPPEKFGKFRMNVVDFEKDDDRNFHIDLIHNASNLRATQYRIKTTERLQSKLIAGKIIPAIVTTTASVTGLVCLEFYKLLQNKKIEQYRNTFINLALPVFQQSEPIPPKKAKFGKVDMDLWTRIDVKEGDITLGNLVDFMKKNHSLDTDVIGVGTSLLYSSWMPAAKKTERLGKKVSELVQEMMKTSFPPKQKHFNVEITGTIDDEDVEVPVVTLWFK